MRFSELRLDVWYPKGLLNTEADALPGLRSLVETTVSVDADTPTYPLHSYVTATNRDGK